MKFLETGTHGALLEEGSEVIVVGCIKNYAFYLGKVPGKKSA
jgi:hypothetical protein